MSKGFFLFLGKFNTRTVFTTPLSIASDCKMYVIHIVTGMDWFVRFPSWRCSWRRYVGLVQDLLNRRKASEMDNYQYVMHGKVYKLDQLSEEGTMRAVVNVSFGGLLMQLIADHNKLSRFDVDSMVYLLLRKAT
jgi:hypothetical protein